MLRVLAALRDSRSARPSQEEGRRLHREQGHSEGGYSLIEVMVSMAVLALIVGATFTVVTTTESSTVTTTNRVSATSGALTISEIVPKEVRSAVSCTIFPGPGCNAPGNLSPATVVITYGGEYMIGFYAESSNYTYRDTSPPQQTNQPTTCPSFFEIYLNPTAVGPNLYQLDQRIWYPISATSPCSLTTAPASQVIGTNVYYTCDVATTPPSNPPSPACATPLFSYWDQYPSGSNQVWPSSSAPATPGANPTSATPNTQVISQVLFSLDVRQGANGTSADGNVSQKVSLLNAVDACSSPGVSC